MHSLVTYAFIIVLHALSLSRQVAIKFQREPDSNSWRRVRLRPYKSIQSGGSTVIESGAWIPAYLAVRCAYRTTYMEPRSSLFKASACEPLEWSNGVYNKLFAYYRSIDIDTSGNGNLAACWRQKFLRGRCCVIVLIQGICCSVDTRRWRKRFTVSYARLEYMRTTVSISAASVNLTNVLELFANCMAS
jgi:hypothetical protein